MHHIHRCRRFGSRARSIRSAWTQPGHLTGGSDEQNAVDDIAHARVGDLVTDAHDLIRIEGGAFVMGFDDGYPEEGPAKQMTVASFRLDYHPVTNAQFMRFASETGYATDAERSDPQGSAVFVQPDGPAPLDQPHRWWALVAGADWRHPWGPGSSVAGALDRPVVHITHPDAEAYAQWAGLRLPTEAEWEFAALAGADHDPFGPMCLVPHTNVWRGEFPWRRAEGAPPIGPTAVGTFGANAFGLVDMIGNVWEWTADWFNERHASSCCGPPGPTVFDNAALDVPLRVAKGGSFLCSPDYCARYRPAARLGQAVNTSTIHLGFRCAAD
jgi:formylglycine-generating enzyme